MILWRRFVLWLAREDIEVVTLRANAELSDGIQQWQRSHEQGLQMAWSAGYAHGEQAGRRDALDEISKSMSERCGIEVTYGDIERARRGLLH